MRRTKNEWVKIHMCSIQRAKSTSKLEQIWNEAYYHEAWDIYTLNALIYAYGRLAEPERAWKGYLFAKEKILSEITASTFTSMLTAIVVNLKTDRYHPETLINRVRQIFDDALSTQQCEGKNSALIIRILNILLDRQTLSEALTGQALGLIARVTANMAVPHSAGSLGTTSAAAAASSFTKPRFFYNPYHLTQPKVFITMKNIEGPTI